MLLNASTLANLCVSHACLFRLPIIYSDFARISEVFRSQGTFQKKGSLYGLLDRAETKFGSRLLKEWIGRPLVDKRRAHRSSTVFQTLLIARFSRLQERLDAIDEIREPARSGQVVEYAAVISQTSNRSH